MPSFNTYRTLLYRLPKLESYFQDIKVSEIKDYWTTVQVYKIKKLYDSVSTKNP